MDQELKNQHPLTSADHTGQFGANCSCSTRGFH